MDKQPMSGLWAMSGNFCHQSYFWLIDNAHTVAAASNICKHYLQQSAGITSNKAPAHMQKATGGSDQIVAFDPCCT